jgi:glutamyl-tRNA reductase
MILCVGLNYRSSPASLRESVALTPEEAEAALEVLRLSRRPEAMILSTCNRTEFYTRGEEAEELVEMVAGILRRLKGVDLEHHGAQAYVWRTGEAVLHLLRVTSGLDSMVIGETQIAGQVRQAAELAGRHGMTGTVLRRLVDAATRCARRVRTETSLTEGSISMASVAVGLGAKVLGNLGGRRVMVIGAGEASRLAVSHLVDHGVREFVFANRTLERAQELAARHGGSAHPLHEIPRLLLEADLVISATASSAPMIQPEMAREAMRARRGRSMVYVDLAVPRDVHPEVHRLPGVFVYSTESVKTIVDDNLERRRREAPRAESIVQEEGAKFLDWYGALAVTPTLATVRAHVEEIRARKLRDFSGRFREDEQRALDQLTRSLVNEILREPTLRLVRSKDDPQRGPQLTEAVRHLFNLDSPADPGEGDETRDPR